MTDCSNCTKTFFPSKAILYLFQSNWENLLRDFLICIHVCFWMIAQAFYRYLGWLCYCHCSMLTDCGSKLPFFFVTLKHTLLLYASYVLTVVIFWALILGKKSEIIQCWALLKLFMCSLNWEEINNLPKLWLLFEILIFAILEFLDFNPWNPF